MPLTDTACKKAVCPEGRASVRMADEKVLYLEVNRAGGKYWRWKGTSRNPGNLTLQQSNPLIYMYLILGAWGF